MDGANEQQNVDLKRQLQLIEQEASVLTTKNQTLEADNEKLQAENKKNQVNIISHHLLYVYGLLNKNCVLLFLKHVSTFFTASPGNQNAED